MEKTGPKVGLSSSLGFPRPPPRSEAWWPGAWWGWVGQMTLAPKVFCKRSLASPGPWGSGSGPHPNQPWPCPCPSVRDLSTFLPQMPCLALPPGGSTGDLDPST